MDAAKNAHIAELGALEARHMEGVAAEVLTLTLMGGGT